MHATQWGSSRHTRANPALLVLARVRSRVVLGEEKGGRMGGGFEKISFFLHRYPLCLSRSAQPFVSPPQKSLSRKASSPPPLGHTALPKGTNSERLAHDFEFLFAKPFRGRHAPTTFPCRCIPPFASSTTDLQMRAPRRNLIFFASRVVHVSTGLRCRGGHLVIGIITDAFHSIHPPPKRSSTVYVRRDIATTHTRLSS